MARSSSEVLDQMVLVLNDHELTGTARVTWHSIKSSAILGESDAPMRRAIETEDLQRKFLL
jgi:hypothetical protein